MSLTNFFEAAIINHFLRNNAQTPAATVYLALFTAAPGEAGGGTEVSGGGYVRKPVTFTDPAGTGATANTGDVLWASATADWGTVTHVAVMDALTGGNMLVSSALTTPRAVVAGESLKFAAGAVALTLD